MLNKVNKELRTIQDKVYFTHRGDDIITQLNRLIKSSKVCKIHMNQKYYILVPYNKQLEIRDMRDRYIKIIRKEMLKILGVTMPPKNS